MFITLNGITAAPDQWQETFDDDMLAAMQARIDSSDAILLGRVTYDEWYPYWPTSAHEPFATYINSTPKYVVSNTLNQVEWGDRTNISLLKGDTAAAITQLKQQPGKNIAVEGSPSLVRYLIANDLLDELTLMIHPVVAGRGQPLFPAGSNLTHLKLINSQSTRSGTIIATYTPLKNS
jgi:dihydrofolate reductase